MYVNRALALPGNNLAGTLPDSLGGMVGLTALNVGSGALYGTLPVSLSNLQLLRYAGRISASASETVMGDFSVIPAIVMSTVTHTLSTTNCLGRFPRSTGLAGST